MNLYDIAVQYRALLSRIDDDGVIPEDTIAELDALNDHIEIKIDVVAKFRAELLADAAGIGEEILRLRKRELAAENHAERLRAWMGDALTMMGTRKIKTSTHTVSLQRCPPKVVITGTVPPEYMRIKDPEPDKAKIKEHLALHDEMIDGDGLHPEWAHLEQRDSVRVR